MFFIDSFAKDKIQERRRYFKEGRREIAESNLRTLLGATLATLVLLLSFLLLTPLILTGWKPSAYHLFFVPAAMFMCMAAGICIQLRRRGALPDIAVSLTCVAFEIILYTFALLLDTAGTPDGPATFIPLLFIALPALFVVPPWVSYGLIAAFEFAFVSTVRYYKPNMMGEYDIFRSLAGLAFSLVIADLILSLRIRDHHVQMRYKALSTRDALSGILNKQSCTEACRMYLRAASPATCSLLFLDLDDFKAVNDKLGHYVGDIVLRCTGDALHETFRSSDIIGRFGGDEFLVLVRDTADATLMLNKSRAIQQRVQQSSLKQAGVQVSCSMGIVLAENQDTDFEELLRQSDSALYEAKRAGKGQCVVAAFHAPNAARTDGAK